MQVNRFAWTDEDVKLLCSMWGLGRTLSWIGKTLGCSRNAVAGKAHRLGLPKRPSPIKRGSQR